jgi:hypothetical protein
MSPAARKRISAAMKQRWAKWKGKSAPKKTKARPAMSAAARKKLSALMKARWERGERRSPGSSQRSPEARLTLAFHPVDS